ncbi:KAP family P-loop NTPase fold protein [Roseomonas elaeocarpi]|uniref:P-loop NTPase fold protein n=1 Tax=Roseomonas elaeocarpi TaxID=907779 RepID=A0ABV6JWL3_9PROT
MRLFVPPIDVGPEEGFTPQKDLFGRAAVGEGLTHLVSTVTDPLVIAVDGKWGSGKSTFLRMWMGELRKVGFPDIHFDAFENDYFDDAFTALAGEIIGLAEEKRKEASTKAKRFKDTAVEVSKVLARSGLRLGVRVLTAGAVDGSVIDAMEKDVAAEASGVVDKLIGEKLTQQKDQKATIASFKSALSDLPSLLTNEVEVASSDEGSIGKRKKDKPLIIVIDELDRCKPLFALQILERAKHLFSVQNVHFVLGTHLGQLSNSVQIAYGLQTDANMYLQKFIHFSITLERAYADGGDGERRKFIDWLIRQHQFESSDRNLVHTITNYLIALADKLNLGLRDIERIVSSIALTLACSSEPEYRPASLICALCVLKVKFPELYAKAKVGDLSFGEVQSALQLKNSWGEERRRVREVLVEYFEAMLLPDSEAARNVRFPDNLAFHGITRASLLPYLTNGLIDRMRPA